MHFKQYIATPRISPRLFSSPYIRGAKKQYILFTGTNITPSLTYVENSALISTSVQCSKSNQPYPPRDWSGNAKQFLEKSQPPPLPPFNPIRPKEIRWSIQVLDERLSRLEGSEDLRKTASDIILKGKALKKAIQDFRAAIRSEKISRCTNDAMKVAFEENGVDGVDRLLLSSFIEFAQDYLNEEDLEAFSSLRQLTDLRYPGDWHPAARALQRKIIMHVGPTNSGKTYNALKRLEEAKSGIYCGPLRLLAHEIYERMNMKGIPCNLITGEERKELPGEVPLTASTVEMANLNDVLDVAVVDEIQMISDPHRGWAWTQALLGLQAKELHLCGETAAVPLVKAICATLDEEVEVRTYERLTPLTILDRSLNSNFRNITKGDCVVTFSRKNIFAVKQAIEEETGYRCAVAYGGLPPETRSMQARLFNDSTSGYNILVASDAVGMGLNLNIKRIIFETLQKFDGKKTSLIPVPQIKQIAGRAGRFSTAHGVGEVTTLDQSDLKLLHNAMAAPVKDLESGGLQPKVEQVELFSQQLTHTPTFSELLDKFEMMSRVDGLYFLCNYGDLKIIADMIENHQMDLIDRYNFSTAPVNTSDPLVMAYLNKFASMYSKQEVCLLESLVRVPETHATTNERLKELESAHRVVMIYMWLSFRYPGTFSSVKAAEEIKNKLEDLILQSLHTIRFTRVRRRGISYDYDSYNNSETFSSQRNPKHMVFDSTRRSPPRGYQADTQYNVAQNSVVRRSLGGGKSGSFRRIESPQKGQKFYAEFHANQKSISKSSHDGGHIKSSNNLIKPIILNRSINESDHSSRNTNEAKVSIDNNVQRKSNIA
ncbi:hypothetical protein G9A89_017251 [Geosiphon pyriformis]|nr:hypothetical protein G9A89_017251 [Geosiphon pyriformis]